MREEYVMSKVLVRLSRNVAMTVAMIITMRCHCPAGRAAVCCSRRSAT